MRLRSEVELWRPAPAANFHVLLRAVSNGYAGVRNVGNSGENFSQTGIEVGSSFLPCLDLLAQVFGFGHERARILAALFQLANIFRGPVAAGFQGFGLGDSLPALRVHLAKILQHRSRIHATLAQLLLYQRQIVSDEIQIKHEEQLMYRKQGKKCT